MGNFLEAVKTRELPVAAIEQWHISSSACVLVNNAMELGRTLRPDTTTGRPKDDEKATHKWARPYREPGIHPSAETD
jgi:hypothetical protein